ncbi:MAG: hypothetical protein Q9216_006971 [Gyalolechia sp. 2 TL-2023]
MVSREQDQPQSRSTNSSPYGPRSAPTASSAYEAPLLESTPAHSSPLSPQQLSSIHQASRVTQSTASPSQQPEPETGRHHSSPPQPVRHALLNGKEVSFLTQGYFLQNSVVEPSVLQQLHHVPENQSPSRCLNLTPASSSSESSLPHYSLKTADPLPKPYRAQERTPTSPSDPEDPDQRPSELRERVGPGWLAESESDTEDQLGSEWLAAETEDNPGTVEKSKMPVSEVRNLLRRNRLYVKDEEAAERGKRLVKKATDIMDDKRNSAMTSEKAQEIVEDLRFHSTKNEKTLLINLWGLLVNKKRFAKKILASGEEPILTPDEEAEAAEWIRKAWIKDDRMWTKWDAEFFTNTLPEISTSGDAVLDALLEGVPRVSRPVPDICIGFDGSAFSDRVLAVLEEFGCKLTAEQYLSFFEVEAKGADGTMEEAENQCARGGAAMAKSVRGFFTATNAYIDNASQKAQPSCSSSSTQSQPHLSTKAAQSEHPDSNSGPDTTSFAFSLALTPQFATMFVHWAEVTAQDPKTHHQSEIWQQTELRQYFLHDVEHLKLLHTNIDNILDWGCGKRKRMIEAQCEKYAIHMAGLDTAGRKAASKAAKDALENPLIKRQKI